MHTSSTQTQVSYWRPLRIDRYILEEIIGTYIGVCCFILFILLMFQTLRLAEFLIVHGAPAYLLARMAFFMAVSFLPTALPLSFLISVLIGFGRLSGDSELIALKASGVSVFRLSIPIFLFGLVVSIFSIILNVSWVPTSVTAFKTAQIKVGNSRAVAAVKPGTFTSGFFDLLIFADKVDNEHNRLHKVFIYDEREYKNPLTYVAREAEIVPVKTSSELGAAIVLRLYDGSMHHNNLETHTYEKMEFESYHLYLKVDEGSEAALIKPHMIPQNDLLQKIQNNGIDTYEGREFRGEYWRRYATALSPLVFVLLGIGFGSFRNRTAKTGAVLTGFAILIVYWALQTYGTTAVLRGTFSPFFAMQLPNVVLFAVGIYAFRRAAW
jgi:lipopolysaccharide export system permease protein